MTNLEQNPETLETSAQITLTPRARFTWFVVILILQFLYFPINRALQGGVTLATPWDRLIPLWPIWAVPYLLGIVWWLGFLIWATWKMDDTLYQAFVVAGLVAILVSYAIYLLYPTYVDRPSLVGNDWLTELLRLIYTHDRSYNACPSGHTYNTVLIALFWWRWRPQDRLSCLTSTVLILLSTLFTRQHNLPDLIGGIIMAWLGYRLGLWWVKRQLEKR